MGCTILKITTVASGSTGNTYVLSVGSDYLVLDAGASFKKLSKTINFNTQNIKGVLITHEHADHSKYINDYLKNGLDVYINEKTKEALSLENHYRLHVFNNYEPFIVSSFKILAYTSVHDAVDPVGFLIQNGAYRVLYATDTQYIKYKFENITHALIECNYSNELLKQSVIEERVLPFVANRIRKTHMSLETSLKYLNAIDQTALEEIVLIHLSKDNAKGNLFKDEFMKEFGIKVTIAKNES